MDNSNCNTEHKKYQHLTSEERHIIEVRLNIDKWSIYAIAKNLGRPYNTVKNEVDRGMEMRLTAVWYFSTTARLQDIRLTKVRKYILNIARMMLTSIFAMFTTGRSV